MCIAAQKQQLRLEAAAWRNQYTAAEKSKLEAAILEHLLSMQLVQDCLCLLTYVSTSREIDTRRLMEWAWSHQKIVGAPVCRSKGVMDFYEAAGWTQLQTSKMGILEPIAQHRPITPTEKTVVIVPGLLFDQQGYRLGWGGGYYDRWLGKYDNAVTVGLVYAAQRVADLPHDALDIPVQICVTDQSFYQSIGGNNHVKL